MRDTVKSETYFDEYISEESERVIKFRNKIASGTLAPDRVLPVKRKLCSIRINLLIAKYSSGVSIDELKSEFLEIVESIEECWSTESYDENLRLLSLCVLFNVDIEIKDMIAKLIKEKGEYDCIIECLCSNVIPCNSILNYPDVYEELWNELCNRDTEKIREYIQKKWYKSHDYSYWFDAHKSKEKLYFGYWAFEVAALMKVMKIDASSLNGIEYFPYDLINY